MRENNCKRLFPESAGCSLMTWVRVSWLSQPSLVASGATYMKQIKTNFAFDSLHDERIAEKKNFYHVWPVTTMTSWESIMKTFNTCMSVCMVPQNFARSFSFRYPCLRSFFFFFYCCDSRLFLSCPIAPSSETCGSSSREIVSWIANCDFHSQWRRCPEWWPRRRSRSIWISADASV